jgi:hypothetical protein
MKGDFSRWTFDRRKHYAGVLLQQGRAQLDADWNEHETIVRRRMQIEARDVIGEHGGPRHRAGFAIEYDDEGRPQIGPGRYYVAGRLCENDKLCWIEDQPFYDGQTYAPNEADLGELFYLDVWERYVDAVGDPDIRDVALGGADTAARVQTVWTVRRMPITKRSLLAEPAHFAEREREFDALLEQLEEAAFEHHTTEQVLGDARETVRLILGKQGARATHVKSALEERIDELERELGGLRTRPSLLEELERLVGELIEAERLGGSEAAKLRRAYEDLDRAVDDQLRKREIYRAARHLVREIARLSHPEFRTREEQLRAEIEDLRHGAEFRRLGLKLVDALCDYAEDLEKAGILDVGAGLAEGELEEFETLRRAERGTMAARASGPQDAYRGAENLLYRVEIHDAGEGTIPTLKWSRDNGSTVARVRSVDGQQIVIEPPAGGIERFPQGGAVEVTDLRRELAQHPGVLRGIADVDAAGATLTLSGPALPKIAPSADNPVTVRLWDSPASALEIPKGEWIALEDGIEVVFSAGRFRTGDFWLIPARAASASIEWPVDGAGHARHRVPLGIEHVYAPLALVRRGPQFEIHDRRRIFDPLTGRARSGREQGGEGPRPIALPLPSVPALRITAINWDNDDDLSFDLARESFAFTFDRALDPRSANAPDMVIVLARPFYEHGPSATAEQAQVTLGGRAEIQGLTMTWKPAPGVAKRLAELKDQWNTGRILLLIVVKGHAVWAEDASEGIVHLAGRSRHVPARRADNSDRLGLSFPTGGDERVSDFESWCHV